VDADSGTAAGRAVRPNAEPRQRWRLVFRRRPDAPQITHRELADDWLARLARCGLPLPTLEGLRQRSPLTFAAPLPLGMPAERELADLVLAQRKSIGEVREAVTASSPQGIELIELYDVWLGMPPLAASIAAAEYRVDLAGVDDRSSLEGAIARIMAARTLPRRRFRGQAEIEYDLRPLVDRVELGGSALRIRSLFDPARGAGRPEEVVAALGEVIGRDLVVKAIVRERLLLADELGSARPSHV
jgi:radical SAM-linked protein